MRHQKVFQAITLLYVGGRENSDSFEPDIQDASQYKSLLTYEITPAPLSLTHAGVLSL